MSSTNPYLGTISPSAALAAVTGLAEPQSYGQKLAAQIKKRKSRSRKSRRNSGRSRKASRKSGRRSRRSRH
jgi:hypothetical protein